MTGCVDIIIFGIAVTAEPQCHVVHEDIYNRHSLLSSIISLRCVTMQSCIHNADLHTCTRRFKLCCVSVLLYVQLFVYSAGFVMCHSKLCGHYCYDTGSRSRKSGLTCRY